jgi:hypothetical protein
MVAALAAVAMVSAIVAIPMQQVSASNGGDTEVKTGDNRVKIEQENECRLAAFACANDIDGEIDQNSGDDSPGMSNDLG